MDDTHGLLGRLAVHKGWINHAQLVEAVAEQGRFGNESKKIGEILVDMGYLSDDQIQQLLQIQRAFIAQSAREAEEKAKRVDDDEDDAWRPGQDPFAAAQAARAQPAQPAAQAPPAEPPPAASPAGGLDFGDALELDWSAPTASAAPTADQGPQVPEISEPQPGGGLDFGDALELDWSTPAAEPAAEPPVSQAPVAQAPVAQPPFAHPPDAQPPVAAAAVDEPVAPPAATAPRLRDAPLRSPALDEILAAAARRGASDVHLHPGAPIAVRIHGALVAEGPVSTHEGLRPVIDAALTPLQRQILDTEGQLDFAYEIPNVGRFRANVYEGHRGRNAVFRFIPSFIPSLAQLGLPSDLSRVTSFHQGMVLVTGPSGCGKSTTLAALVDLINEERQDHILTVEDPVEYLHPSKRCLVNQREVHRHTTSFARALRAALREDPDILVIGELRDLETISLAMTAAETGHLVLATLHTSNAITTINRLVGAFPPEEQGQIRTMLSESLRAVISQRLVPRSDGRGRVAALEILKVDRAVANTIRENRTFQLRSTLQTGQKKGMLLLDNHLALLVRQGIISRDDALKDAEDPRLITGGA